MITKITDSYCRSYEDEEIIEVKETFLSGSLTGLVSWSMFFTVAIIIVVLFLLWAMYCLMYAVARSQRRWNYEKVNDTEPLLS